MSDDISKIFVGENADLPEEELEEADKMVLGTAKQQVPKMCETRWSARLATVSYVIAKYKAIHLALHDISIESSQTEVRNNAMSYYRLMQSWTFIVALVVAQFVLSFTHPLCLSLQKVSCDVVKAYHNAKLCRETISRQRSVTKFKEMWEKAKIIAPEISSNLSIPWAATRSRYRTNVGVDTEDSDDAEAYYRRNLYFPFIDHCIKEFEQWFSDSQNSLFLGYKLLPHNVLQIKHA